MDIKKSFDILEIDRSADLNQARKAYREKVKSCHPDQVIGDNELKHLAEEKLKEINLAYEVVTSVLSDPTNPAPASEKPTPSQPQKPVRPMHQESAPASQGENARAVLKRVLDLWSHIQLALARIDFKKLTNSIRTVRPRPEKTPRKPSKKTDFGQILHDILTPGQATPPTKRRRRRHSQRIRPRHGRPRHRPADRTESISRISPIPRVRSINKNK